MEYDILESSRGPDTAAADGPPSVFTAVEEELGLRLESSTGPVDILVIEHLEQPTPN